MHGCMQCRVVGCAEQQKIVRFIPWLYIRNPDNRRVHISPYAIEKAEWNPIDSTDTPKGIDLIPDYILGCRLPGMGDWFKWL